MDDIYETHISPDNREYYYNKKTKESTFVKPDILKGTDDFFDKNPWVEYKSNKGKTFYYNTITKESRWEQPKNIIEQKTKKEIKGIGLNMNITDYITAKALIEELLSYYEINDFKTAVLKLTTEPIFRAVNENARIQIIREYLYNKEIEKINVIYQQQQYFINEICKLKLDARNFFEFNIILEKHPYYSKIQNKAECYETYIIQNNTEIQKMDEIIKANATDPLISIKNLLTLKECKNFDKNIFVFRFSKHYRKLVENAEDRYTNLNYFDIEKEYLNLLQDLYNSGKIYYKMKFKDALKFLVNNPAFNNLLKTEMDAKDIFFDFMNSLENRLKAYENTYETADLSRIDKNAIKTYFSELYNEKEEGEI